MGAASKPKDANPPSFVLDLRHLAALLERRGSRTPVEDEERPVVEAEGIDFRTAAGHLETGIKIWQAFLAKLEQQSEAE